MHIYIYMCIYIQPVTTAELVTARSLLSGSSPFCFEAARLSATCLPPQKGARPHSDPETAFGHYLRFHRGGPVSRLKGGRSDISKL